MNKRQTIKWCGIYLLLLAIGYLLLFTFHWSIDSRRFLSLAGFLLVVYSSFQLAFKLTLLLFPSAKHLNFSTFRNKEKTHSFKSVNTKGNRITLVLCLLIVLILVLPMFTYFKGTSIYERNQLINFGQVQKVLIHDTKQMKRSTYAVFHFFFNGNRLESHLLQKKWLHVGDSSFIIFSTDNTDIVQWADDFKNQENR
jgi:hypothetical protein